MALTFEDHPMHVLDGGPRIPFLLPRHETFLLLRREGIRRLQVLHFTRSFSRKSPEQFIQWLRSRFNIRAIVVGDNFRFGKDASGDVGLLKRMGLKYDFRVVDVKPVRLGKRVISSTQIRRLLSEGKTVLANRMLGRAYAIGGEVVHGKHLGHQIGFPTANLRAEQLLPKDGVYACGVRLGDRIYRAAMNLGKRPTFKEDDHRRLAEVHLLHYYGRLYGKRMTVHLLSYLRPEKKFSSSKELVRQIRKDIHRTMNTPLKGVKAL
jgi:riboflavin kinase/FMN adenylyltransferase